MRCIMSVLVLAAMAPLASAQQGGDPQMALLDVAYIFKNHSGYTVMKTDLQNAVDLAEAEVKRDREKLHASVAQLGKLSMESPEYKSLEETLTRQQSDLNVRIQTQRKRFVEQEARMLLGVYQDIREETESFCKQHGIRAVLRFNGDPATADTADQVVALINRPVIYHDPGIDITQLIMQKINQKQGGTNTATLPNGGKPSAPPRPGTTRPPAGGAVPKTR